MEEGLKRNNSRNAYQLIKTLRKNFQPKLRNIKNAEHRVLTDLKDILRRWRDYAKNLYHDDNNLTNEDRDQSPTLPILESEVENGELSLTALLNTLGLQTISLLIWSHVLIDTIRMNV